MIINILPVKLMFRVYLVLLTIVFLQPIVGNSSNVEQVVQTQLFNIDNGLSQSNVTSLYLDSYGFLWVGTQDGLNRYDGYSFKTYRNNPLDDTSLCNNSILSICEDNQGNIWVGTWDGLSVFHRLEDKFTSFYHDPDDPKSISASRIFDVLKTRDGAIWVKTIESLDLYNPTTNSFTRYPHFSDPHTFHSDINDFAIFEDSENRLWIGTKDGLLFFDRSLGLYKRYSHDPKNPLSISSNRITSIIEDNKSNLWIATANGLNRFVPQRETFYRYANNSREEANSTENVINTLFVDSYGRLLVGTRTGLFEFSLSRGSFNRYAAYADGKRIYTTSINSIIEDSSKIIWVGSQAGLVKWDTKGNKFNLYGKTISGDNLFSSNSIASLFDDGLGQVWVGTWGAGLHQYNRRKGSVVKYSQRLPDPYRIANDFVHAITRLKNGTFLIGTRSGVQRFNPASRTFTDFFKDFGLDASGIFADNRVYSIKEDGEGNIWFATRLGLHRFSKKSLESFYHVPSDSNSISSNEIHCIELDGDFLWIGTFNGLNRLDIKTGAIKVFRRGARYKESELISNDIVCLRLDSKGSLWVGTPSGLHKYDAQKDEFSLYTQADGLPNNLVYAIEEDSNGDIWVSTNWGLAKLDPVDNTIQSYDVSDGLQSYEFNVGASHKSKTGELFFGGIQGFNAFFPESIQHNQFVPPIAITSIEFIGSQGQREVSVLGKKEITIKRDYSLINIEFAVLDFTHPSKNIFKYKMEGLEDEWIDIGNRRSATFSNLKEGTYTLRVIGANSDLVWNEEGVSLKIIIRTDFWSSRLAYWMYGFLFVGSIVLFLRSRTQILRRTSRLLREREHTMAEVESQKEALLIQNKSITDSINYAKRIQEALIPSEQHFRKILPESFILYLPKDIVSGDFYWINETKNKIFVAAIDCTGHGVPGAFMSIIGVELLRNITNVMGINDAAEILNRLDMGVHDTFSKGVGDVNVTVKDGMDVSFCVIDKEQNALQFAGAFTNLYIVRDSKIIEIKGDRYSVGTGGEPDNPLFNSHLITIEPDDMIYMFTDGYVDQFGGPDGKKYKFRRFRHLLLNIHKYPLEIQRKYLLGSMNEWKGNHEQVDDILIIGIKPDLSVLF